MFICTEGNTKSLGTSLSRFRPLSLGQGNLGDDSTDWRNMDQEGENLGGEFLRDVAKQHISIIETIDCGS